MWLGNKEKVYILDKTENNPVTINGRYGSHPAWAVEYDIASNTCEFLQSSMYSGLSLTIRPDNGCLLQHFLRLRCPTR